MSDLTYFVFADKTAFVPLRFVYPECEKLIDPHPAMYPLRCLAEDGCPANMQCMDYLVKRVQYLFDNVFDSKVEMLITYYKYRDRPASLRGAVFSRDLSEPRVLLMNQFGFRKLMKNSSTYVWTPSGSYTNMGAHRNIIPVENLIRGR